MSEEPPVSVSTDDVQARPHRTGRSRIDLILALTAIFLSLVSLFVAIENATTQRDLVSADTWPYVTAGVKNGANDKGDIVISVGNSGVGPAKLQNFELFYKGQPVGSSLELLRRCCGLPREKKALAAAVTGWLFISTVEDVVLRAGDELEIVVLRPDPANPQLSDRFRAALGQLSFRGCYCSVLDECWDSNLGSTRVKKIKQCPLAEHPFRSNGR